MADASAQEQAELGDIHKDYVKNVAAEEIDKERRQKVSEWVGEWVGEWVRVGRRCGQAA